MAKPLLVRCSASHTVGMRGIAESPSRALHPSGRKTAHRGVAARCRGASGKTRLQAAVASRNNPRRATMPRQSPLLLQSDPHKYSITTYTSYTSCSASNVTSDYMQSDLTAPGTPAAVDGATPFIMLPPLVPSEFSFTNSFLPSDFFTPNPISQKVSVSSGTITNTTQSGHIFYPGSVTTTISPAGSGSSINTVGIEAGESIRQPAGGLITGALTAGLAEIDEVLDLGMPLGEQCFELLDAGGIHLGVHTRSRSQRPRGTRR